MLRPRAAPVGAAPGYPRAIAHAGGSVTIPDRPVRVLSDFNGYEFDALLALGVPVVGRGEASGNALSPWQRAAGGADVPIRPFYGGNLEAFAAADPDVLFMTDLDYGGGTGSAAGSGLVAPVVAVPGDIEEPLRIVAEVMGLDAAVLDAVRAGIAEQLAAFTPARVAESIVAFSCYDDGQLYLATDRSPLHELLTRAGLPGLTSWPGDTGSPGGATVSLERVDLLEADLLIGLLDGASPPPSTRWRPTRCSPRSTWPAAATSSGPPPTTAGPCRGPRLCLPTALPALDRVLGG